MGTLNPYAEEIHKPRTDKRTHHAEGASGPIRLESLGGLEPGFGGCGFRVYAEKVQAASRPNRLDQAAHPLALP